MSSNEEKEGCHYVAVKKISAILPEINLKHKGDFYCLNFLLSVRTENKLRSHEKVCRNIDFRGIVMPSEKDSML